MKGKRWIAAAVIVLLLSLTAHRAGNAHEVMETEKYIALTFDDGPSAVTTPSLLDGLQKRGVHATFFVLGMEAEREPELLRRMQTEGHQVAQHTYSHVKLSECSDALLTEELAAANEILTEILGEGDYWLRPPYGLIREEQCGKVNVPLITWSVDSEDWKLREEDAVYRRVLALAGNGDIILMHDIHLTTVHAALRIVDELQAQGYTFLTVEELMQSCGVDPGAGEVYRAPALPGLW